MAEVANFSQISILATKPFNFILNLRVNLKIHIHFTQESYNFFEIFFKEFVMKTKICIAALALCALSAMANPAQQAPAQTPPPVGVPTYPYAPQEHYYHGLPQNIMATIQKMYPGVFITDVDWEPYGYEIELSNRMELHFDAKGNFLGQKYDD